MDRKFHLVSQGLYCPHCGSDEIVILSQSNNIETIVKCKNCGLIIMENELEEKENEKTRQI